MSGLGGQWTSADPEADALSPKSRAFQAEIELTLGQNRNRKKGERPNEVIQNELIEQIKSSDEEETRVKEEVGDEMPLMEEDSLNDYPVKTVEGMEEAIDQSADALIDISEAVKIWRRSSKLVSKTVKCPESMKNPGGHEKPPVKRRRSKDKKTSDNKRKSIKSQAESATKGRRVSTNNNSQIDCPECQYRTICVRSWRDHLRNTHSTTPALAGFALLCGCGHESFTEKHRRKCESAVFTVVCKRTGPIRRLSDAKAASHLDPSSIQEKNKVVSHLSLPPLFSLDIATDGILSPMDCLRVMVDQATPLHVPADVENVPPSENEEFDHSKVTARQKKQSETPSQMKKALKRKLLAPTTSQCVMCEAHPKTAVAYACHLRQHHKSTLEKTGIYLLCSCHYEVRIERPHPNHSEECNGRLFTIHKLDKK